MRRLDSAARHAGGRRRDTIEKSVGGFSFRAALWGQRYSSAVSHFDH
jgi:hypothetical protein